MSEELLIDIMELFIRTTVYLSAPLLITIMIAGFLLNVVQTVTQLKEQSITYVPKCLIVAVVFIMTIPFYIQVMAGFTEQIMSLMETAAQ